MPESTEDEVSQFSTWLYSEVRDLVNEALAVCDDHEEDARYIQTVYEVMSRNMGALDALTCLRAVPRPLRRQAMRQNFLLGKRLALETHRESCKGCEGGNALEQELNEIN